MSVRGLGYIGIGVRDLAAWERFATSILGLQLGDREAGVLFFRMDECSYRVAVHSGGPDDLLYVGWELADAAALDALGDRLRRAGYACEVADADICRKRQVRAILSCVDPAGIRAEFFVGPVNQAPTPFVSPRDISGFRTGDEGVGHVVLAVPDAEAMMAFYRDICDFRVSDFIEFQRGDDLVTLAFMHCNPRHHSLAFMQLPSSPKRLSHIMLEVNSLDDVGSTYSLCEREGIPIAVTLGRHTNDEMFSFYCISPSGFNVEYGWGGVQIDDAKWEIQHFQSTSVWGHNRVTMPPASTAAPVPERIVK